MGLPARKDRFLGLSTLTNVDFFILQNILYISFLSGAQQPFKILFKGADCDTEVFCVE
jgi:hypothetical protein